MFNFYQRLLIALSGLEKISQNLLPKESWNQI